MSTRDRKVLSQKEIEDLASRFYEDSDIDDLVISDDEDRDPNFVFQYDSTSEVEDNWEQEVEENEDALPEIVEDEEEEPVEERGELGSGETKQYVAKSGRIWNTEHLGPSRRPLRNIVTTKPGPTAYTNDAKEIFEVFNLFLTSDMKDKICNYTNQEATRVYKLYNEEHPGQPKSWKNIDVIELDAFIGVLLSAGALRCRKENIKEMWSTDESIRRNIFTASMPRDRFIIISKFVRFDDKTTREERRQTDKLAAFREIWEAFVSNCQKAFVPHETVTVDEQLVSFRGKCPFKQYMSSKPAKYGVKIWASADVKTTYLHNMQIYTGKQPDAPPEKNQGFRVVNDLVSPLFGTGRGVTTDNFFTSTSLAEHLLSKNITLLGTVRKNKPDTPKELNVTKQRPIYSSEFVFSDKITMVAYTPKKNKLVHLLSTQHDNPSVSEEESKKPIIILDYNATKGAVDNADKMIREYTCSRRTSRWPFRLFMNLIDTAALNAFVIYVYKNPDYKKKTSSRKMFLQCLGKQLAKANMEQRILDLKNNPSVYRAIIACGINSPIQPELHIEINEKKRGRCHLCPRSNDKKVNIKCSECKHFVCAIHRRTFSSIKCVSHLSQGK